MSEINDSLIRKLEEISTETHLPLEQRLIDTAIWYHKNRERIPSENLKSRLDFTEKAFDIMLEMIAMLVNRMQLAEGRPKSRSLWMPNGMKVTNTETGKTTRFD